MLPVALYSPFLILAVIFLIEIIVDLAFRNSKNRKLKVNYFISSLFFCFADGQFINTSTNQHSFLTWIFLLFATSTFNLLSLCARSAQDSRTLRKLQLFLQIPIFLLMAAFLLSSSVALNFNKSLLIGFSILMILSYLGLLLKRFQSEISDRMSF